MLALLLLSGFLQARNFEAKILGGTQAGKIGRWETVEIGFRFPAEERQFRNFLSDHHTGRNPYAVQTIRVQFTCNGKTWTRPAFYMEDAAADEEQNKYISYQAEWPWRVRFAVPDTGRWECLLLTGESKETSVPQATNLRFTCVSSAAHGYLRIASDHRRFEYEDGTPFFVIGQNIAWADEPVLRGHAPKHPIYTAGYYDVLHYIDDLAANGGNYLRIVMICWSTGIEWEETGVYNQSRAWALDTMMHLAEARGLKIHLCLDLTTGFARDNGKDFWHPYRRDFQKPGMTTADILRDSAALAAFDQYIRYVHARWAFSPAVSTIELLGEQARWEGYEGREIYFDEFFARTERLLRNELEDHSHFISSSFSEHGFRERCSKPAISFVDVHQYTNDLVMNQRRFRLVNSRAVRNIDKPFVFGEMGIITGPVNACDPDDWDYCNDITMHNSLWATAFCGAAGTGLYWWQWKNDAYRKANFPALRWFIDSVAVQMRDYTEPKMWTGKGLEAFYCMSNKNHEANAVGWVHNTSYWWGNMCDSCRDRDGKQMLHPKDDDKTNTPEDRSGNTFLVQDLHSGADYVVTIYDTRNPGRIIRQETMKTNLLGNLRIAFPAGAGDFAFSVRKKWLMPR